MADLRVASTPFGAPGPGPSPAGAPATPGPDYLVLVYTGSNVGTMLDSAHPISGSFRLLPELKALAPDTAQSSVTFFVQGYECTAAQRWETHRYLIGQGQLSDQTADIQGQAYRYTADPMHHLLGKEKANGSGVSLFDKESFTDFLRQGLSQCPHASNIVLLFGTHGQPAPAFAGEAIISGEGQGMQYEQLPVPEFTGALAQVEQETGRRFNLIDLNCCQMGKAENALEIGPVTDLLLASPQNEASPGSGRPTTDDFQDMIGACRGLLANPHMTPEQFGEFIIADTEQKTRYQDNSAEQDPIPTLDLYRTDTLPAMGDQLGKLGDLFSAMLDDPQQRAALFSALNQTFRYDSDVVDLKGFLEQMKATDTPMDGALVDAFRGQYLGKDYTKVGPFAAFLPHIPTDTELQTKWWMYRDQRKPGDDVNALLTGLLQDPGPDKDRKKWLIETATQLNRVFSNLFVQYPAMLSVVPQPDVSQALQGLPPTFHVQLLSIDTALNGIVMDMLAQKGRPDIAPRIAAVREQIKASVTPVAAALHGVDFSGYAHQYDSADGPKKLLDKARGQIRDEYAQALAEPVAGYQQMQRLPRGWKNFIAKLADVITREVIPAQVAALT